ncbi:MAG: hypothetical protein GX364_09135 [Firmicutes bacterium]|nr:hypothetical protein [Bacillota bacterium]
MVDMVSHLLQKKNGLEIYIPSMDAYSRLALDSVGKETLAVQEIHTQQGIGASVRFRLSENEIYPLFVRDKRTACRGDAWTLERHEMDILS